eukprot:TRINITY_DN12545_c0_g1_i1.p1 TRINITY_DN12545_c0_g1~~TRINITY_DN12545_c0_g1_i1.p1  ORF type:complete len:1442 (+),score=309.86 TRINITY_DN12545_c0_g1_i1:92-4417(+)
MTKEAAAQKIQRRWRIALAKKVSDNLRRERNMSIEMDILSSKMECASVIQNMWRAVREVKKRRAAEAAAQQLLVQIDRLHACLTVQVKWRYLKAKRLRLIKRNNKAIIIQSAWMRYRRKKRLHNNRMKKCRHESATIIQSYWKGCVVRSKFRKQKLQRHAAAATQIQCLYRKTKAASLCRQLRQEADNQLAIEINDENACLIQSAFRSHLERKQMKEKHRTSENLKLLSAVSVIQSWVRVCQMRVKRRAINLSIRQNESAAVIQAAARCFQSKQRMDEKKSMRTNEVQNLIKYEAARTIQMAVRAKAAESKVDSLMQARREWLASERQKSYNESQPYIIDFQATTIQSAARSRLSLLQSMGRRHSQRAFTSTKVIQRIARGYHHRLTTFNQYQQQQRAARTLQTKLPLLITCRLLRAQAKATLQASISQKRSKERDVIATEAAIAIQCAFRKRKAAKTMGVLSDQRSCTRLQQLAVMEEAEKEMLCEFATTLQCRWRVYRARRVFIEVMERHKIEERILREQEEADWLRHEKLQQNAATQIQSIFRGYSTRKKMYAAHTDLLLERAEALLLDSAIVIQSFFRGTMVRAAAKLNRQKQATANLIQRLAAGYKSRLALCRIHTLAVHSNSVTTISRMYRGHLGRVLLAEKKEHAEAKRIMHFKIMSATNIQRQFRGYVARKLVADKQKQISERNKAATDISRCYRGHVVRKYVVPPMLSDKHLQREVRLICDSATVMTRMVRGHLARISVKKYRSNRQRAVPILQKVGRSFAAKRQLFGNHVEFKLHSSAILIQKTYRMHAAIEHRKLLALYEKEHRLEIRWREMAICRIQRVLRAGTDRQRCQHAHQSRLASGSLLSRVFKSYAVRKSILPTYKMLQLSSQASRIQNHWRSERESIRAKVEERNLERKSLQLYVNAFLRNEEVQRWAIVSQFSVFLEGVRDQLQCLHNDELQKLLEYKMFVAALGSPYANAAAKLVQDLWKTHRARDLFTTARIKVASDKVPEQQPTGPSFASRELPKGKIMETWQKGFIDKLTPELQVLIAEETVQRDTIKQQSVMAIRHTADSITTPKKQIMRSNDNPQWDDLTINSDRELDERRYELQMGSEVVKVEDMYCTLTNIESVEQKERHDIELLGLYMAEAMVRPLRTKRADSQTSKKASLPSGGYNLPPLRKAASDRQESAADSDMNSNSNSDITYFASRPTGGIGTRAKAVSQLETLQRQVTMNEPLVTFVSVSNIPVREEDVRQLLKALKYNTHVVSLDLSNTEIRDATAEEISNLMVANNTLVYINLSGTRISDIGASHLASGIAANVGIRKIDLSGTMVSVDVVRAIEDTLRSRVLSLQQGKFRPPKQNKSHAGRVLRPPPPATLGLGNTKKNSSSSPAMISGIVADTLSVLSCSQPRMLNNTFNRGRDVAPLGVPSLSDPFLPVAPAVNAFSPKVGA